MSEHMFREVGLIPAPEVTHTTLVRLLTYYRKKRTESGELLKAVAHARATQAANVKTEDQMRSLFVVSLPLRISMCRFKPVYMR